MGSEGFTIVNVVLFVTTAIFIVCSSVGIKDLKYLQDALKDPTEISDMQYTIDC